MLDGVGSAVSRRLRGLGVLASMTGCLDANPDFDAHGSSGASESSSAGGEPSSGASSGDSSTAASETGPVSCAPDGFEPDDTHPQIELGTLSLVLETVDAIDRFHFYRAPGAPGRIQAALDDPTLRVCTYVRCEDGLAASDLVCTSGLSGSDGEGAPGCCGGPVAAMTFACGGDGSGKVLVEIDGASADCSYYALELGVP